MPPGSDPQASPSDMIEYLTPTQGIKDRSDNIIPSTGDGDL